MMILPAWPFAFDFFDDGHKDRSQFICFFQEWIEFFSRKHSRISKQFKPIGGFIQFLQGTFDFAYKISIRFCALGFTVLCSYRRS